MDAEKLQPREKALRHGISTLSDKELLAIALGSGTSALPVEKLAEKILEYYQGSLSRILLEPIETLQKIKGIGQARALSIAAILELGLRRQEEEKSGKIEINSPEDVFKLMKNKLSQLRHEEFWTLHLRGRNELIKMQKVSQGGLSSSNVDQRIIFRECGFLGSEGIILVHNHPTGSQNISKEDIGFTEKIIRSCAILDYELQDHIIICRDTYVSLRDRGLI